MTKAGLNGGTSGGGIDLDNICRITLVFGLSEGVGWLHIKPRRNNRSASASLKLPSRHESTASRMCPSRYSFQTQSTRKWKPAMSDLGRRPQTVSRIVAPKPYTSDSRVALPVWKHSGAIYPMVPVESQTINVMFGKGHCPKGGKKSCNKKLLCDHIFIVLLLSNFNLLLCCIVPCHYKFMLFSDLLYLLIQTTDTIVIFT
jgi:hypothetical protein